MQPIFFVHPVFRAIIVIAAVAFGTQLGASLQTLTPRKEEFPEMEITCEKLINPDIKYQSWVLLKRSESLRLSVDVGVEDSAEAAIVAAKEGIATTSGLPELQPVIGSYEGKMLGGYCLHSPTNKDGSAIGGGRVSLAYGRYTVRVSATKPLYQTREGREMIAVTKDDLKLVDAIAASFLKKIKDLKT